MKERNNESESGRESDRKKTKFVKENVITLCIQIKVICQSLFLYVICLLILIILISLKIVFIIFITPRVSTNNFNSFSKREHFLICLIILLKSLLMDFSPGEKSTNLKK